MKKIVLMLVLTLSVTMFAQAGNKESPPLTPEISTQNLNADIQSVAVVSFEANSEVAQVPYMVQNRTAHAQAVYSQLEITPAFAVKVATGNLSIAPQAFVNKPDRITIRYLSDQANGVALS